MKISGLDKDRMREFLDIDVDEAAWKEFVSRRNGALLGVDLTRNPDLKEKYSWREGEEFAMADFNGLTLYMAGSFVPRDPTLRTIILTGDRFLEEVDGRLGVANQILVKIEHRDAAAAVAERIDGLDFPIALETKTQFAVLDQAMTDLDEMLSYASSVIAVMAVVLLLGLANATSMAVRERVREVGLLRSIGFSRRKVVALIAAETLGLSLAGGILGCLGAMLVLRLSGAVVSVGSHAFPVVLSPTVAVLAIAGAAAVGLAGGLPAGIRIGRRPVVDSLRSVG